MTTFLMIIVVVLLLQIFDNIITVAFCCISKRYYTAIKPVNANGAVGGGTKRIVKDQNIEKGLFIL